MKKFIYEMVLYSVLLRVASDDPHEPSPQRILLDLVRSELVIRPAAQIRSRSVLSPARSVLSPGRFSVHPGDALS
jgi:hypothetical protein